MALKNDTLYKMVIVGISLTISLLLTEFGLRHFLHNMLAIPEDERSLTYHYDDTLGWFPIPNSSKRYTGGSRPIEIHHNSRGFRDIEHTVDGRPGIMFLGDSFVWGFDAEQTERFTEKLRLKRPDWSVYNLGVSGYGTDQEFLLMRNNFEYYKPKIVVLLFCTDNDQDDNSSNIRYGEYFKPYATVSDGRFEVKGIPVPTSENYFFGNHPDLSKSYLLRLLARVYYRMATPPLLKIADPTGPLLLSMDQYIRQKGSIFVVALQDNHPGLEKFLADAQIPHLNLANPYRYPTHFGHWTPEGHVFVSNKIDEFLANGHYYDSGTVELKGSK